MLGIYCPLLSQERHVRNLAIFKTVLYVSRIFVEYIGQIIEKDFLLATATSPYIVCTLSESPASN